MTNPIIEILDVATGEEIRREMTEEELQVFNERNAKIQEFRAKEIKAKNDREGALTKLAALGLTANDLKALGL
jgi:hypothetical protein